MNRIRQYLEPDVTKTHRLAVSRGVKRRPAIEGTFIFDGVTHTGAVAFQFQIGAGDFRELDEWVLDMLELVLDTIDPTPRLER